MDCEECSLSPVKLYCIDCEESLCPSCDDFLHRRAKRQSHLRSPLCTCGTASASYCFSCSEELCSSCQCKHPGHSLVPLSSPRRLGLYWDLSTCSPSSSAELHSIVRELRSLFTEVRSLKAYTECSVRWRSELEVLGFSFRVVDGMRAVEGLLIDMSLDAGRGLTHVVLLSQDVAQVRSYLSQLQDTLPSLELQFSASVSPVRLRPVPLLESAPVALLVNELRRLASAGLVIQERAEFLKRMAAQLKVPLSTAEELLLSSRDLHRFEKVFPNGASMEFLGLRLEALSKESFLWALKSLKVDEMLPTERAIQSRVSEAFDCRPAPEQWQALLERCRCAPEFSFCKFVDPVTGLQANVVYPCAEQWESLDLKIKEGDILNIQQSPEWAAFVQFMNSHFLTKGGEIDESRAITGGRYGCAQFLQFCGTPELRKCSLGRLSYMVQLAINEDLLRYQQTLLVWTPTELRAALSEQSKEKLQVVKETIVQLLKESRGMSLAQLPLNLRRKLPFHLNVTELGFPKLKDLLGTMPSVSVELRGANHPYAIFKSLTIGETRDALRSVMDTHKWGLPQHKLEEHLKEYLKTQVNWAHFACSGLLEFISQFNTEFEVLPGQVIVLRRPPQKSEASTDHSKSSSMGSDTKKAETPRPWKNGQGLASESGVLNFDQGVTLPVFGVNSRHPAGSEFTMEPPPGL